MSEAETKRCSMPDCSDAPRPGQRYCPACHRVYMRAWRAKRRRQEEELKQQVVKLRKKVVDLERERDEREAGY